MDRRYFLIGAVLLLGFSSCRFSATNNEPSPSVYKNNTLRTSDTLANALLDEEFPIDLMPCVLDLQVASQEQEEFIAHFKPDPLSSFASVQSELVAGISILNVFKSMSSQGHELGKFFRGLRVIYGLNEQNTIALVYVPIFADSSGELDNQVQFALSSGSINLADIAGPIYVNEYGGLVNIQNDPLKLSMTTESVNRYRNHIYIKPNESSMWRNQINGVDANSSFVPFQELFDLLGDNNATGVNFISAARFEEDGIFRHSLIYKVNFYNAAGEAEIFKDKAANLSTLCPPGCPLVYYNRRD